MIKINMDSFLLFDVNRKTIYVFANQDDYKKSVEISSLFRELNDAGNFLPVCFIKELYWALHNCVDFYLVDVGLRYVLRPWEAVASDVVFAVEV